MSHVSYLLPSIHILETQTENINIFDMDILIYKTNLSLKKISILNGAK